MGAFGLPVFSPLFLDSGYFSLNRPYSSTYPLLSLIMQPFSHSVIHPTCQVPGAS